MLYKNTMTLKKWYRGGITLPRNVSELSMRTFIASSASITSAILERKLSRAIQVAYSTEIVTAYADPEQWKIVFSQEFIHGNFSALGEKELFTVEKTIAVCLGIMVHEIGHFAYSPATLEPQINYIRDNTSSKFVQALAKHVSNLVEDIWIENEIQRNFPSLAWMVEEINKVMLPEKLFDRESKNISGMLCINSEIDSNQLINYLLFAKVTGSLSKKVSSFVRNAFSLARSAANMPDLKDRCELSLTLYDLILGSNNSNDTTLDTDTSTGTSTDTSTGTGTDITVNIPDVGFGSNIVEPSSHHVSTMGTTEYTDHTGSKVLWITPETSSDSPEIKLDPRYSVLTKLARSRASAPQRYNSANDRGRTMRHMTRIVDDGKIFADKLQSNKLQPLEIVILLDCSYSMVGHKLDNAVQAVLGCTLALVQSKCTVSVVGHTTGMADLTMINFYRSGQSIQTLSKRLYTLQSQFDDIASANCDGHAILEASKLFSSSRNSKLLIVISDGEPSAYQYKTNELGIADTQYRVNQVRKRGIKVVSLSIDSAANFSNNYIYGEQYNICNTDADALDKLVKSVLMTQ